MKYTLDPVTRLIFNGFKPAGRQDCIEWAEKHIHIPGRESATPGPLRIKRTPHWRHWYNIASARALGPSYMGETDPYAHLTEQMWIVKGRQVGGTIFLYILMMYLCDQHPGPMGYFLPKKEHLPKHAKGRILPLFKASKRMLEHMPKTPAGVRESITKLQWTLDTMSILWKCSSIPDELRSDPLRWLPFDEFDLNPLNVGGKSGAEMEGEGDSIEVAMNAMKTFKGLAWGVTTPTHVENMGWVKLCNGSHERLFVECLGCGANHVLSDFNMCVSHPDHAEPLTIKEAIKAGIEHEWVKVKDAGVLCCPDCGNPMRSKERDKVVAIAGNACRWVPGQYELNEENPTGTWTPWAEFGDGHTLKTIHPAETTVRTGWLPTHYSAQVTVGEFAAEEMRITKRGRDGEIRAFRNNWHALPNIPEAVGSGEKVEDTRERLVVSIPAKQIPEGCMRIITTVDQQENEKAKLWFPYVARGYGLEGESWLIDEGIVRGIEGLDRLDQTVYVGGKGQYAADIIGVDGANGHMNAYMQQWCQKSTKRRVIIHGRDRLDEPWKQRVRAKKKAGKNTLLRNVRYFYCRSDAWKSILNDLYLQEGDVALWHINQDASDRYIASLGSEHLKDFTSAGGIKSKKWQLRTTFNEHGVEVERDDNHWFDAEWMNAALANIMGWNELVITKPKAQRQYGATKLKEPEMKR